MELETKGCLTLLIAEIKRIINEGGNRRIAKIERLLDSWIAANDLHPEKVKYYKSLEECEAALEILEMKDD